MKLVFIISFVAFALVLQAQNAGDFRLTVEIVQVCGYQDTDIDTGEDYRWQFWSRNESETQFYKSTIIGKDEMIAGTCLNADNPNTFGPPLPYTVYNGIHNSSNKSEFLVYLQVAGYEKDCFADNSHNGDNLTYKPTCYCGLLGALRCQDKDDDNYALSSLTPVRVNLNELVPGAYSPIQTIDITVNGVRKYSVNYRYRFTPPVPETAQLLGENTVCSGDNYTLKLNYSYPVKQIKWYENINYQQVKVIDGLDYQCVYPVFLDCNNCSGPECQACICQECLFNNPEEACYQSCQSCVISHNEYVWQEVGSTNVPELTLTAPVTNSDQNFRQYRAVIIGENNEYSLGPSQPGAITTVLRGPALLKEYVYNEASLLLPEDVNQIHPGIEIQHVSCFLEKTGSISITSLDNSLSGNGIYNFRLYNGTEIGSFLNITQVSDTNPVVFEGLASGNYQLRIINSLNGGEYCFSEYTISIRQPGAPLSALSVNPNDVGRNGYSISCFGNADGELIIETHGGLGAYSYLFNEQLYDSGYFEGLSKGTYSFLIQDEVGCTEIFQTEITSPEILEFTALPGGVLQSVDYEYHIRCFGESNGEITGTLFGGILPYQVLLSQESSAFEATSETNGPILFSELGAGNYTLIATDKNSCTILEEAISLLQPPPLTAEIQEIQPPVCPGGNDGKFTVKISGNVGIPRLKLEGKTLSGSQVEFTNLMAGNYLLEFQDEFQCSQTLPVSIPDNPKPLNINILEVLPPVCPGTASGKVILMGENGSFQSEKDLYTFKIPFHEDVISSQGIPATIDGLLAGIHRITVYDTHDPSCQYSVQVEIPSMRPDPLTVIIEEITEPLCFDSSDGRVKLSVSGGDAPYFFHLEDSTSVEITGSLFEINQLSRNEQGYTLYVYDKNHLIWPESCTVSVVLPIHTPQPVSANYTLSPPSCFGESDGKIQVTPTGGTAPYNIRWPGSALESPLLSGIPSGQYEVSITDSNQCTFVEIITLNDPLPLEFEKINTQNPSCSEAANGWVWMSARGGNGYISYKLNENGSFFGYFKDLTSGNYTLTATDENGCQVTQIVELSNEIPQFDIVKTPPLCAEGFGRIDITVPNNFQAKEFILDSIKQPHGYFDQIPEGEHLLKITDATGCAFEEIVNLTIPNKLVASVRTLTPSECGISNGQAMAIIEKGLPPYKIYWKTLSGETVSPNQLSEGDYKVYIIDNNLCQLQLNYHQPSVSTLLAEATILQPADSEGKNGSVQLKILGGSGNYQVNWSSGFGNTLNSNLSAGQGEAIISDLTTSCETTVSFFIEKTPPLSYESLVKNPSCGQYDGNIELMVSGGTAPYLIEWESGSTGKEKTYVSSGLHHFIVKDARANELNGTVFLSDQDGPVLKHIDIQNTLCGQMTGEVTFVAAGGNSPYMYSLDGNEENQSGLFKNLSVGEHTFDIFDNSGCSFSGNFQVLEETSSQLTLITEKILPSGCTSNTGAAEIGVFGGIPPYTYSWSHNSTLNQKRAENLPSGNYRVVVFDVNGCSTQLSIEIPTESLPEIQLHSITEASCATGYGSATIIQTVQTAGAEAYYLLWDQDTTREYRHEKLEPGWHSVTPITESGCIGNSIYYTIPVSNGVDIKIKSIKNPSCFKGKDGEIILYSDQEITGIAWDNGSIAEGWSKTGLTAGLHTLTATDINGCKTTRQITLTQPEELRIVQQSIKPLSCYETSDGEIRTHVIGGTPPYSFKWNNGMTSQNAIGLSAGLYSVDITDARNCLLRTAFIIPEFFPETSPDLPDSITICLGDEYIFDIGNQWQSIKWNKNGSAISTSNKMAVNSAGIYTVVAINSNSCAIKDSVIVETVTGILNTHFVIPSSVATGDTVVAVDLTWPVPERLKWTLPQNARIVEETEHEIRFIMEEVGSFPIELQVFSGNCTGNRRKEITVIPPDRTVTNGRISQTQIVSAEVFPNPTDGEFSLEIKLNQVDNVEVNIIEIKTGKTVYQETLKNQSIYFNSGKVEVGDPGLYAIVLTTGNESKVLRLMVK